MPPTTTRARRSRARVVVFTIEMSWETTDVLAADTADVLAADTRDVLAADTTDVLAADTTDVLAADNKEAPVPGEDDGPSEALKVTGNDNSCRCGASVAF